MVHLSFLTKRGRLGDGGQAGQVVARALSGAGAGTRAR